MDNILQKTDQAIQIFTIWRESYFTVRTVIEKSSIEARWEFDEKRLFEKTDYMIKICYDIKNFAEIIQEFQNIFGPELKALTGNTKGIDEGLRKVKKLVQPLNEVLN